MPCKLQHDKYMETCHTVEVHKTKYACIVEVDESMRARMEGSPHKNHEDHIAGKGLNSLSHYNLVRKFIPMPQAMEIPDAKGSNGERIGKNSTKCRHARWNEGRKVHFASSMDLCHLKNSELELHFQKYKGGAVLRRDVVKDDSDRMLFSLNTDHRRHKWRLQK